MQIIKIQEITKTCESCPAQWEGKTDEGKTVYIRYRWGELTIQVSPEPSNNIYEAVNGVEVINKQLGDSLNGYLTYDELKNATAGIIEFPPSEAT